MKIDYLYHAPPIKLSISGIRMPRGSSRCAASKVTLPVLIRSAPANAYRYFWIGTVFVSVAKKMLSKRRRRIRFKKLKDFPASHKRNLSF